MVQAEGVSSHRVLAVPVVIGNPVCPSVMERSKLDREKYKCTAWGERVSRKCTEPKSCAHGDTTFMLGGIREWDLWARPYQLTSNCKKELKKNLAALESRIQERDLPPRLRKAAEVAV